MNDSIRYSTSVAPIGIYDTSALQQKQKIRQTRIDEASQQTAAEVTPEQAAELTGFYNKATADVEKLRFDFPLPGSWQQLEGGTLTRTSAMGSTEQQVGERTEFVQEGIERTPFTESQPDGGRWDGTIIREWGTTTTYGTFETTTNYETQHMVPYSSGTVETGSGHRQMINVKDAPVAKPFDFEGHQKSIIPEGERPMVLGRDGEPRNAFEYDAQPLNFNEYLEGKLASNERPLQLSSGGAQGQKVEAYGLTTSASSETTSEERILSQKPYEETSKVYETYTDPPPSPPVEEKKEQESHGKHSGGGGDSDDTGNYYVSVKDEDGGHIAGIPAKTEKEAKETASYYEGKGHTANVTKR